MMLSSDHVLQEKKKKKSGKNDERDSTGSVQLSAITMVIIGVTAWVEGFEIQKSKTNIQARQGS